MGIFKKLDAIGASRSKWMQRVCVGLEHGTEISLTGFAHTDLHTILKTSHSFTVNKFAKQTTPSPLPYACVCIKLIWTLPSWVLQLKLEQFTETTPRERFDRLEERKLSPQDEFSSITNVLVFRSFPGIFRVKAIT